MNITTIPIPGTNYSRGRGGVEVDTIVYHWIDGTQADADAVFTNPKNILSSHASVQDENVHQYVSLTDTAYHAGVWSVNRRSFGLEHSAQPGRDASESTYETSAHVVLNVAKLLNKKVGDLRHIPHNQVIRTACPGTLDIARIVRRAKELEAAESMQNVDQPITGTPAVLSSASFSNPSFSPFLSDLSPSQVYSDEVARMQRYLVHKGFLPDLGANYGYYGPLTQAGVDRFQKAHGIMSASQFGWWYPMTRAAANRELS